MDVGEEDEDEAGDQDMEGREGEELGGHEPSSKRPRVESTEEGDEDPRDGEPRPASTGASSTAPARSALPADFFSDPSQAPPPPEEDEEDINADGSGAPNANATGSSQDVLDLEWQQFQASVVNAPDLQETYERATIVAEPELAPEVPQGFPGSTVAGAEEPAEEVPEVLDEEALRRKKEQEERELIMDRLLEEEQAQEEADARVTQLKNKLEALKKKREAARAAKKGAKAP
ncbi:hypothetical protein GY45DRAFT_1331655 [Cubamyces sp. BRFM 1775]|nr:hypothetical protein GY45DRAFT_1331655 [Cubamyces sp. BRFM 1775]